MWLVIKNELSGGRSTGSKGFKKARLPFRFVCVSSFSFLLWQTSSGSGSSLPQVYLAWWSRWSL
jgi:hypothetical protein